MTCSVLIRNEVSGNILFFAVGIPFFSANVSDFTHISPLLKIKNFERSFLYKSLNYISAIN